MTIKKPTVKAVSHTDKALTLMFEVGRMIRHAMIVKETMPLPLSYIETLRFIHECPNPTMRAVAEYLRITAPSATAIIESLAREECLTRKQDVKDRRVIRLSLSSKGEKILEKTTLLKIEALRGIIGSLNSADQRELIRILSKVVKK